MRPRVDGAIRHDEQQSWAGRVIEDRYVVVERIGTGATSHVYRALQRSLGRQVAIKLPRPSGPHRGFADEARLLHLAAPRAVSVIDIGTTACGAPYLVTELIDGITLEEALRQGGALAYSRAIRVALELCAFLAGAHRLSIVHRDLKPANVMLAPDGAGGEAVRVLDFGLGTRCDRRALPPLEAPPGLYGTPAYMAPEAIAGEAASHASDIYSLGCLLFEMLTGRPPFTGTLAEVLAQHLYDAAPRLPAPIPDGVKSLVAALLRREPIVRPTALEAAAILEPFAVNPSASGRR